MRLGPRARSAASPTATTADHFRTQWRTRSTDVAYAGFISYSHALDGKLAPAIQAGLQRFAKPWYRLRALRMFRDDASLSVDSGLWTSISAALVKSDFF